MKVHTLFFFVNRITWSSNYCPYRGLSQKGAPNPRLYKPLHNPAQGAWYADYIRKEWGTLTDGDSDG
jgi:hypothetical protein